MRIAHLADLHFTESHYAEAAASINAVVAEHERSPFDLIILAGDTWDGPVQNSARARFGEFLALIRHLADCAPVAMIYGTPSHDTEGSLDVFETLEAGHEICVLRPGRPYALGTVNADLYDLSAEIPHDELELLLFGVPEPNKRWLLAGETALGKDESAAAIREAMTRHFLALGAIRQQYPELPCVCLYHGQVSGAKSGTGFEVEGGTGLAVSRDDLAAVGADYLALGDIHEPQRIGDLPAYYPGSIYPINWGETHKAGCNVVEIRAAASDDLFSGSTPDVLVSRLEFPHPIRTKLARKPGDGWQYKDHEEEVHGKLVWEEWTMTRADAEMFDEEAELGFLGSTCGALPGSRVTLNILPTETVRAGEITAKRHLREKVQVYAENSALTPTASSLDKSDALEREAEARGATQSGAHIRINRLRLRGARGIWKNQRLDEIDLDLDAYGPGVIALVGQNGRGKTTIIENMQPWGRMLTRDGTLKSHFRLRDSFRDLYFTDERTGWKYRSLIQINAATASGTAEYFLSVDKGQGFEPVPGVQGRVDPYEEAIAGLFGSIEMYLRTAFVTQRPAKGAPDIAEATKGEKKTLFAELAGIDYLDAYRETCKARADERDREITLLDATIAAGAGIEDEIAEARARIAEAETARATAAADGATAAGQVTTLATSVEALAARVQELNREAARKADLEDEIEALVADVKASGLEIEGFRSAVAARGEAEAVLAKRQTLEGQAAAYREEKRAIDEENHRALVAHQATAQAIEAKRRTAQVQLDTRRRELSAAERALAVARARLTAPVADTCPTCGQKLPADRLEALAHARAELEKEIDQLEHHESEAKLNVTASEGILSIITLSPPPVPAPFLHAADLADLEDALDCLDEPRARETIRRADEAAVRIEAAEARAKEKTARREALAAQLPEIESRLALGPDIRARLAEAQAQLDAARRRQSDAQAAMARAEAIIESAALAIEAAEKRRAGRETAEASRATAALERDDWRFLERACGPDGIQALELDALAPSIAAVANRLLSEAYGSRYSIRFDTTRIGGKGAKAKQIEDFLVMVLDAETGEEQEISTLSGGEAVWIKRSLYDAFAVIRAQNTGVQFLTCFQDEADGALDPEARMQYLRMLEAAHRESGRYQTILITHSRELQAMVSQVIDVTALAPKAEEAKENAA
jgi:exonuclease SbcC